MLICEICKEEKENRKGLSYHCSTKHGMKFEQYVIKFEHNGVHPTCKHGCGQETKFLGGRFMDYVNGHQMIGVPKKEETRKKIGDAQRGKQYSEERKQEISNFMKQYHKDGRLNSNIEAMAAANRGKQWTEEHREKMGTTRSARISSGEIVINRDAISSTITQKYVSGGFEWSRGKHISPKLVGKPFAYYRSSWELRHMLDMDVDPTVISYQYEPMVLTYEWEGKERRYIPDFVVVFSDGRREVQEVGVKKLKNMSRNVAKATAAEVWCQKNSASFRIIDTF